MSLKAGKFLRDEEEERHSKRDDCRGKNNIKKYFERKLTAIGDILDLSDCKSMG